jgi:hypothetical protein
MEDIIELRWRTASYSTGNGGNCVEVAAPGRVLVRDTMNRDGAVIAFTANAWCAFTATIKHETA